jgi:hypothetical protein
MLRFIQFFHKYLAWFPLFTFISNEINAAMFDYYRQHQMSKNHFSEGGFYMVNYFVCMFSCIATYYFMVFAWVIITVIGLMAYKQKFYLKKLAVIVFIIGTVLFYLTQSEYYLYY